MRRTVHDALLAVRPDERKLLAARNEALVALVRSRAGLARLLRPERRERVGAERVPAVEAAARVSDTLSTRVRPRRGEEETRTHVYDLTKWRLLASEVAFCCSLATDAAYFLPALAVGNRAPCR